MSAAFMYVEHTLDIRLTSDLTLRLWVNANGKIPDHAAATTTIELFVRRKFAQGTSMDAFYEDIKTIPDLNAFQVIRKLGLKADHGFVCYTVPFEDVHG